MSFQNPFARLFRRRPSNLRVAELLPGEHNTLVKLSLRQIDAGDTSYDCISYDRSTEHGSAEVDVDGERISIPQPLHDALKALRRADSSRHLWADILMGSTPEERTSQALNIKATIENATKVYAWLGTKIERPAETFRLLRAMGSMWNDAYQKAGLPGNIGQVPQAQILAVREVVLSDASKLPETNEDIWDAVVTVLSSPYFISIQSTPDIILAEDLVFVQDDESISWHEFLGAACAWYFALGGQWKQPPSAAIQKTLAIITQNSISRWRYYNDDGVELLPMIQFAGTQTSADPRERVYSMLPITRPSKRPTTKNVRPIIPEYSMTTQDVFTDAARYIIEDRQDLFLWMHERPPCSRGITGLPSWVPDWTTRLPDGHPITPPNNGLRRWWDSRSLKQITVDDSSTLHVQAYALDRIVHVTPIFTEENYMRQCLNAWQDLNDGMSEGDNAKRFTRLWRTLIMNTTGDINASRSEPVVPTEQMEDSFESFLAEERMFELLDCTREQLAADPELQAIVRESEDIQHLVPGMGKSEPFVALLERNTIGRRMFQTWNNRWGMTAVEQRPPREDGVEQPEVPNWDKTLGDQYGSAMISQFTKYLQGRDPRLADIMSRSLDGELRGQAPPGVRTNDIVVVLAGGFTPYILHPIDGANVGDFDKINLKDASKYRYVGDCYMEGVMDGESLMTKNAAGKYVWRDLQLDDIKIV